MSVNSRGGFFFDSHCTCNTINEAETKTEFEVSAATLKDPTKFQTKIRDCRLTPHKTLLLKVM